jgi:thymidylate synthase (FAD)
MNGQTRIQKDVLDYGFVALIDCMPRLVEECQTADSAIVQAARVSYGLGTKTKRKDEALIRYLVKNKHHSPLEMCSFKFHVKAPVFVARQTVRHRLFSLNEASGRYSKMKGEFYIPEKVRAQSSSNKQGSEGIVSPRGAKDFLQTLEKTHDQYIDYEQNIAAGVSRELARISLPLNLYTEWYWGANLRSILHFLKLRMDPHAQWETQQYANAIYELIEPIVPVTMKAFIDYEKDAVTLSRQELEALATGDLSKISKREASELAALIDSIRGEN